MQLELIKSIVKVNERAIIVLCLFMLLDVIVGLTKAIINKEVDSTIFRQGIFKKMLEVIVCLVGFAVDFLLDSNYVGNGVLVAFIAMEGISILENVGEVIPVPQFIKDILKQLNKKGEQEDDSDN